MLYKKLNLPINLPLANDEEIEVNEVENNFIIKLRNVSNINIDATIRLFESFFENSLSSATREKLSKIFKEIIPIIFRNKHKEEGLYQLERPHGSGDGRHHVLPPGADYALHRGYATPGPDRANRHGDGDGCSLWHYHSFD